MVYCSKCGTQNEDNALGCINCKAPLQPTLPENSRQPGERSWEYMYFGLQFGRTIFGLVIGGLFIFSVLAVLFPENVGLVLGLISGVLIMVLEQFGLKMANWGVKFGGWIGNWARGEFSEIIGRITSLQSIQMFGSFMIIVGLIILGLFIYNYFRTRP